MKKRNIYLRKITALALCAGMCLLSLSGCGKNGAGTSAPTATEPVDVNINMNVAPSALQALSETLYHYKSEKSNIDIHMNPADTVSLSKQIQENNGADVDIFFTDSSEQMKSLVDGGYVSGDTVSNPVKNKLVLIKKKKSNTKVKSFKDIVKASSVSLASSNEQLGIYEDTLFEQLGIAKKVDKMDKVNECSDATSVLDGDSEVGVVYYTDYLADSKKLKIIAESKDSQCDIVYAVGIVNNPNATVQQMQEARAFVEYLKTDAVKEVFERYGFTSN